MFIVLYLIRTTSALAVGPRIKNSVQNGEASFALVCNLGIIWFSKLMWFVMLSMWNVVPFRLLGGKDWRLW